MYYIFLFTFDPLSLFPCTPGNHQSVPCVHDRVFLLRFYTEIIQYVSLSGRSHPVYTL